MSPRHPAAVAPPAAPAAAEADASCGRCGRSVDVGEPGKVVCVAHLEFRPIDSGGNCRHFLPLKPVPTPPQLDAAASGESTDSAASADSAAPANK